MSQSFRTEIQIPSQEWEINHLTPVLAMGSCFAERTGEQLYRWHIPVSVNPWGTLFHPLAMESILTESLSGKTAQIHPAFEQEGNFYSLRFPSHCYGHSPEDLAHSIQDIHDYVCGAFPQFRFMILTLGTAWVYRHRTSGLIVTSCHKVPAREFDKILLSPDQVVQAVAEMIRQARAVRPDIKVILTVSPVRHTRDTLELNSVSKSVLRYACHQLREMLREVQYFPAYEIMLDDLRDYRFYESDMIHPSKDAIKYIWEKFCQQYFSPATMELNEALESLALGLEHRPRVPGKAWIRHLDRLEEQVFKISNTYGIRLERELSRIAELKSSLPLIS